uniref:Serpin domain-containing protein n=1 Tax=Tanacetum cinerariifolium TaxID=118510 RepID=A0A699GZT7_TANCI|nr:hypothetical protein [Tanacetum cinerariifolium]
MAENRSRENIEFSSYDDYYFSGDISDHYDLFQDYSDDDEPQYSSVKKKIKLTPTTTKSSKTITVATKIQLDDANNGFKNGNFVCSPFSLETMLGMIAAGAKGKTLELLLEFLGHETMDQLHSESPSLKMLANLNTDGGGLVSLANGAWVDKKLNPINSCYQDVLKTVYKTEAKYVDFGNKREQAVREINSWGNKETRGLIPTIIVDNELSQDAVIVLANALYFKGIWSTPFDANRTKRKDFHLINGEIVSVPFMTSSSEFSYGSFEDFKILKIRYECEEQSNKFSMHIFLPERNDGLRDLLEVFHSNHALFHGAFDLNSRKLDEIHIPLRPILRVNLIQVDERGTEAASSTWADFDYCERPPLPPANFVADHPFMFMIREDTSRAVFFVGVVLNPM